jgi:hypothetical protein
MTGRPEAIEILLSKGHLAEAVRVEGTVRQYITNAAGMLGDAKRAGNSVHGRFICAYESVHCLSMAFLRHYGCRPGGEGHRQQALQVFVQQIGLNEAFATVTRAHQIRNDKTYHEPAPPVDQTTIDGLINFVEMALPLMRQLTG